MKICYSENSIKILEENEYKYFADRCLFCKNFEEILINSFSRHGDCVKLKVKVTESGICKNFIGL